MTSCQYLAHMTNVYFLIGFFFSLYNLLLIVISSEVNCHFYCWVMCGSCMNTFVT
jgi:hypothetical protein